MRTLTLSTLILALTAATSLQAQGQPNISLKFVNKTGSPATLYWLADNTPQGRKAYGVLPPNQEGDVLTYAGHKWLFTNGTDSLNVTAQRNGTHTLTANSKPNPTVGNVGIGTPRPRQGVSLNERILNKINAYRRSNGLGNLRFDPHIQSLCQAHSQDMANRYNGFPNCDHNGANQRYNSISQNDNTVMAFAENVFGLPNGSDEKVAHEAFTGWKNSPGHNTNILGRDYTTTGLAAVKKNGAVYITQMFAASRKPAPKTPFIPGGVTNPVKVPGTPGGTVTQKGINTLVLQKINEYRRSQGLKGLQSNNHLYNLARNHSKDMATRYNGRLQGDHNGMQGRFDSMTKHDPTVTQFGENVFWGQSGTKEQIAQQAFNWWKNSQVHNANMLNPNFTISAVFVAEKNGVAYITQLFAANKK